MVQAGSSNFDEWVKAIARWRQNTYRIIYEAIVSALFHKKKTHLEDSRRRRWRENTE